MWASMVASKAWLHVEELPELLKWLRVPQSCDNNSPKPLSYFSPAGISTAVKSSLSSPPVCGDGVRIGFFAVLRGVQSVGEWSTIRRAPKNEDHISLSQGKSLHHDHRHKDSHTSRIWVFQNTIATACSHNIFLKLPIWSPFCWWRRNLWVSSL